MRSTLFLGAAAALALIATDPAICMQASQPMPPTDSMQTPPPPPADPSNPGEPMTPAPVPDPAAPPQPQPMPPEMAPPAPPVQGSTDAPVGPMATPPIAGADSATSGGTTSAMSQPVPATKKYPPCTKTLQDNCRNPGGR